MTDQIEWPSELPKIGAQRAADLKAGEFYDGREVANVSPIGGGVVVIRFAGGGTLKVMGDQALTPQAALEDAMAAFDLAYRRMRYLDWTGEIPEWPPAMEEGRVAADMLARVAQTDAECKAAIMVAEILTSGMVDLASFYAPGVTLPGKDLLDEYDRDREADAADHAETFRR